MAKAQGAVVISRVPEPFSKTGEGFDIMSGSVSVSGVVPIEGTEGERYGLKHALKKFRDHNEEVGDALLNLAGIGTATGGPVDEDAPRIQHEFQPYPTMLYHSDGRTKIAQNAKEVKDFEFQKFRREPYLKPQIAVLDPAVEKKALIDQNTALQSQITVQQDQIAKLLARFDELEKSRQ